MNRQIPHTPFSTQLSGSARETEIRIRNIFSGPKKRPPVLFLVLMFSVCIFCGNLVSCQVAGAEVLDDSDPESQSVPVNQPPRSEDEEWLLRALYLAAEEEEPFQLPEASLIASIQGESCDLGVVFVTDHLENTLLLGVIDRQTKELTGPVYRYAMKQAVPNVVTYRQDGMAYLLYTCNGQMMGQYRGKAGLIRFDGNNIVWEWPAEGDIRIADSDARRAYEDYWYGHLALLAPGGVDIYTVNPEFVWGQDEPASLWQLSTGELFYQDPSSATELPMPVYFQALNWLVEHTSDPGGWRITSLSINPERCDLEARTDCFTLTACMDNGPGEFTADLFFFYEQEGSRRSYNGLDHAEIRSREISSAVPDPEAREAYAQILENLLYHSILPDGIDGKDMFDNLSQNTFAVSDIDGDSREELIMLIRPNVYAGYRGYILDYHNGALTIQHTGFPSFTFYSNGLLKEDSSHNQGWGGRFWPHYLYRYLPAADRYELVGYVDAWDKELSDSNPGNLPPFPIEQDKSGSGFLYYITPAENLGSSGSSKDAVDQSVYLAWLTPYLGDAKPLSLEYLPLTETNLQQIRLDTP